jgi:hypothetical protein
MRALPATVEHRESRPRAATTPRRARSLKLSLCVRDPAAGRRGRPSTPGRYGALPWRRRGRTRDLSSMLRGARGPTEQGRASAVRSMQGARGLPLPRPVRPRRTRRKRRRLEAAARLGSNGLRWSVVVAICAPRCRSVAFDYPITGGEPGCTSLVWGRYVRGTALGGPRRGCIRRVRHGVSRAVTRPAVPSSRRILPCRARAEWVAHTSHAT